MSKRTYTGVDDETSDDSCDNPIKSPRSGEEFIFPNIEDPDSSYDQEICWSGSSLLNLTNSGSPLVLTQGGEESLSRNKILSQSSSSDHRDTKSSQTATITSNQASPEGLDYQAVPVRLDYQAAPEGLDYQAAPEGLDYSSESAEHLSTAEEVFESGLDLNSCSPWGSELDFTDDERSDEILTIDKVNGQILQTCLQKLSENEILAKQAAQLILKNNVLKKEVMKQLGERSTSQMKKSLKRSKLTANKKDRNYLLGISPLELCREFKRDSEDAFSVVTQILLGINKEEEIFNSQYLLNNLCALYSIIARILNRNATGYSLLLGVMARDGGLREESLKIFPQFSHVRTLQKYDLVLAKDAKAPLMEKLKIEREFYNKVNS